MVMSRPFFVFLCLATAPAPSPPWSRSLIRSLFTPVSSLSRQSADIAVRCATFVCFDCFLKTCFGVVHYSPTFLVILLQIGLGLVSGGQSKSAGGGGLV